MRPPPFLWPMLVCLAACRTPATTLPGSPGGPGAPAALTGAVRFAARTAQATLIDVAVAATVSLINTGTNRTEASCVTDDHGNFRLTFPTGFTPDPSTTYFLEAIKGLGTNLPSHNAVRLRTLARYSNGWTTLTNTLPNVGIMLDSSTTALSLGGALRAGTANPVNLSGLIGHVAAGSPDQYAPVANLSQSDFTTIRDLVAAVLADDGDPVACVALTLPSTWTRITPGGSSLSVSGVSPASGSVGTSVAVTGAGFHPAPGDQFIRFNGTAASVSAATPVRLQSTVPPGATSGQLTVQLGNLIALGPLFSVGLTLGALQPAVGSPGTSVTILGSGFDLQTLEANQVSFGDVPATVTAASASALTVTVPAGATTAPLRVSVAGSSATSATAFTVPVTLQGLAPASGPEGCPTTILGSGFSLLPSDNVVLFNGVSAPVLAATPTQLTVSAPHATSGPVSVTVKGQSASYPAGFTYSAPHVTAVSRTLATTGESLMLEGTLGDPLTVTFPGGLVQTATLLGPGRATVTVPAGATLGSLAVRNGNETSAWPFMHAASLLSLGAGSLSPDQTTIAWIAPRLTGPRYGHSSVIVGPYLYVVGGLRGGTCTGSVERARIQGDGSLGSFSLVAGLNLVVPRQDAACALIGSSLYVVGGQDGANALRSIERATVNPDGSLGIFSLMPQQLTTPRQGPACAIIGSRLYLVGGKSGVALDNIESSPIQADGSLGAFGICAGLNLTTSRSHAACLVAGNQLQIMGGYDVTGAPLASTEHAAIAPDGTLASFSSGPSLALAGGRAAATCVALSDHVYLLGGETDGGSITATTEQASLGAEGLLGSFALSPIPLAQGRKQATTVMVGATLYTLGGLGPSGSRDTVEHASLEPGLTPGALGVSPTLHLTVPRSGAGQVVIGNWLYEIGGYNGGALTSVERAPILSDGSLGAFSLVNGVALQDARTYPACAMTGPYLYVVGGASSQAADATLYGTVERAPVLADGSLGNFERVPGCSLIQPRGLHRCAIVGSQLYVIGGWIPYDLLAGVEHATIQADGSLGAFSQDPHDSLLQGCEGPWSLVTDRYLYVGNGYGQAGFLQRIERSAINPDGTLAGFQAFGNALYSRCLIGPLMIGDSLYLLSGYGPGGQAPPTECAAVDPNGQLGSFGDAPGCTVPAMSCYNQPLQLGQRLYLVGGYVGGTSTDAVQRGTLP